MNKKKLFAAVVLSFVLAVLLSFTASAETTEAHWILNPDGTYSYMNEDGELVKNEVGYWIDGDEYGFDANGIMYTGWVQPYKLEVYSSKEHREIWYYYGQDGRAPGWGYNAETGYMFYTDGQVMPYTVTYSEGVLYASDRNGAATPVIGSGWQMFDGKWYYVGTDEWGNPTTHSGFCNIEGTEYCFRNGFLVTDEWYWYYVPEIENSRYCYIDAGGHPIYDGWIEHEGDWYYVQDGSRFEGGIYTIGQNKYYFDWNGALRENGYVYRDGTYYATDGGSLLCNAWRQEGNERYYFDENGNLVKDRAYTVGDTVYYFDLEGEMLTNTRRYVPEYGCYYWFGDNGEGTKIDDGWFKTPDGDWMFFQYGSYYSDCIVNIEGTEYAFNYEGYLYNEAAWNYFEDADGYYNAYAINANGTINRTPGWVNLDGSWAFVEDGVLVVGWRLVGDTWYYFEPTMAVNTTIFGDNKCYYFFSDGRYIEVAGNGFYRCNSYTTLYLENNVPAFGWRLINGDWYYFSYNMFADDTYKIDGEMYYFDQDGVMQSGGWIDAGHCWYYADASGHLYTGPQNIGGTTYYFEPSGNLAQAGIKYYGDASYLVNDSGVVIAKSTDIAPRSWINHNGKYYYFSDGYFCDGVSGYQIGDKYYAFDYEGVMIADEIYHDRYYKADGSMHTDGWLLVDGDWYYTEEDNEGWLCSGLNRINGKYYYFYNYKLVIGAFVYDNQIITTDASGAVNNIQSYVEGWNLINDNGDGNYYYVQNGELYTGWLGDYYLDPEMYCGGYYEIDGKYYYFYDNGVYARNGWIQYKDGDWLYAKADGSLYQDQWLQSGSAWYYFDHVWMAYGGTYHIDGKDHKFAENGLWLGEVADTEEIEYSNGWHYLYENYLEGTKEGWKYYYGGHPVYDTLNIDGVWYSFGWGGFMYANTFSLDGYYCGANGAIIDYTGWQMIDGRWCYFTTENKAASGWFVVDGTKYYSYTKAEYDDNGIVLKFSIGIATGYKVIDEKLYNFASGGACLGEVTTDGWYYADDEWYYVQNGKLVRDDIISIGGVKYAFDSEGVMISETIVYDYNADRYMLVGKNGAQITGGWYLLETYYGNEWHYVDSEGYILTGTHIIGGASYYFDVQGYYD